MTKARAVDFVYLGFVAAMIRFVCSADMTTAQIEAENTQMTNDLYRLLKKYTGLRNLIRDLKVKRATL